MIPGKKLICLALFASLMAENLKAQTEINNSGEAYYEMSLEDLMNIKVSVASIKALTARESPGIITIITEEEIRNSGFRDLMDILATIPGFDFGVDVEGIIGLGVRGNWAHEGKFLLLIDGLEMNENLFSSTQFGNHYPIENIKQIEIIRGPGSAMYGEFAEYAVINIISRQAEEINGATVSANVSSTAKGVSDSRASVSIGKKANDFSASFSAYSGFSKRSDGQYTDLENNSYDMNTNSSIKNYFTNTALSFKKFQLRLLTDNYTLESRDNYTNITSKSYFFKFDSYFIELKKDLKISDKISLFPKISYKSQLPWNYIDESEEISKYNIVSEKISGSLSTSYDPNDKISINGGCNIAYSKATDKSAGSYFKNGTSQFISCNMAGFLQSVIHMGFADFTFGARYNYNSEFNSSFVPRIGITKVIKKFHFKALYSRAFRAPSVENINFGVDIQPEKTSVFEIEGGMQISDKMFVTLNAYSIRTTNTIVYYYDIFNDADTYQNYYGSGTQGIELIYKYKDKWGWAEINYGYYNAKNNFKPVNYSVGVDENVLLGLPAHKLNIKGNIKFYKNWNLSPSATFCSGKYNYTGTNQQEEAVYEKYPSTFVANLFVNIDLLKRKSLHVGFGIYNLLNTKQFFIQPYNSLHAPIPGKSREFALKLLYDFKFKP